MKNFDKTLFFAVLAVLSIGLFVLYSASKECHFQNLVLRQLFWIILGIALLFLTLSVDYRVFVSISYLLYGITISLLILVLFLGKARGGAHRWMDFGIFSLQPSELAKIALVLALSSFLGRRKREIAKLSAVTGALLLLIPAFILILIEPDLGSALMLIPVTMGMLFIAGARIRHLAGVSLFGLASLPFFWHLLRDYQKERLFVFVNPNIDPLGSGYTIIQSKIAVGSGGLFGKGWLGGTQNLLNFLPERHTDFIFSVVGEEWGFLGAIVLILLYALVVLRCIKIVETTPDLRGRLIAAGFVTLFSLQVIINIGMTIGFLPIVGLTLPLVSYGGSSLITILVFLGLVLNVGMRRPLF